MEGTAPFRVYLCGRQPRRAVMANLLVFVLLVTILVPYFKAMADGRGAPGRQQGAVGVEELNGGPPFAPMVVTSSTPH